MRRAAVFAAACAFGCAAAAAEGPSKPVGIAVFAEGAVSLLRPGAAKGRLAVNDTVRLRDTVETGPGARASFALLYGGELRLNENTAVEFIPGKKGRDAAEVKRGQVWTRLLRKGAGVEIRTPAAVCAVRGTEADVALGDVLTVKVYEGVVDVVNGAGEVTLREGQMTTVAGPLAAPKKPWPLARAAVGDWQEGATSPKIMDFLERLRAAAAAGGNLKVDVVKGGERHGVSVKLKKKGE